MCNLSQKEGSSLLAVLAESERKTLPKNLPLHAETLFLSFWPLDTQFRKQPHRLNKKCANKGGQRRHTVLQVEVATWWQEPPSLSAWETWHRAHDVTWETLHQRSMLYVTVTQRRLWSSSDWMLPGVLFFHSRSRGILYTHSPQGKMAHFTALTGLKATSLMEERKTLNKRRRALGVWNEFLTLQLLSGLGKGIFLLWFCLNRWPEVRKWTWNTGNTERGRHNHWLRAYEACVRVRVCVHTYILDYYRLFHFMYTHSISNKVLYIYCLYYLISPSSKPCKVEQLVIILALRKPPHGLHTAWL